MRHRAVAPEVVAPEVVAPEAVVEAVVVVDIVEQLPRYPVSHSMKEPSCCPQHVPRVAR